MKLLRSASLFSEADSTGSFERVKSYSCGIVVDIATQKNFCILRKVVFHPNNGFLYMIIEWHGGATHLEENSLSMIS